MKAVRQEVRRPRGKRLAADLAVAVAVTVAIGLGGTVTARSLQATADASRPVLLVSESPAPADFSDLRRGVIVRYASTQTNAWQGLDSVSVHQFKSDIAQRLPALQGLFERAGELNGIDWRLLAAVGYQESHWQPLAESSQGARGLMMLTPKTARSVGVANRDDPRENIFGGARYLASVLRTIPRHIGEPDRTLLALAAYNAGYGHVEDARVIAQMRGGDPNSWDSVRAQLPLLQQAQWYTRVKRGYARGTEPAQFVEQVRRFRAVLQWYDTAQVARNVIATAGSPVIPD